MAEHDTPASRRNFILACIGVGAACFAAAIALVTLFFNLYTYSLKEKVDAAKQISAIQQKQDDSTTRAAAAGETDCAKQVELATQLAVRQAEERLSKQFNEKIQELQNSIPSSRRIRRHPEPISQGPQWEWADSSIPIQEKAVSYVERRIGELPRFY